jgi:hypothetical protein
MTMTRSKIIPGILAGFCALALQFQTSTANAQNYFVVPGNQEDAGWSGYYVNYPYFLGPGYNLCSPNGWVCLAMNGSGALDLYDVQDGNILLWYPNNTENNEAFLYFQPDGNVVVYAPGTDCDCMLDDGFHTGTTNWNGDPGAFLAVQDDGNFVVYDANWNQLWAANNSGYYYNFAQQTTLQVNCQSNSTTPFC